MFFLYCPFLLLSAFSLRFSCALHLGEVRRLAFRVHTLKPAVIFRWLARPRANEAEQQFLTLDSDQDGSN